MKMTKDNYIRYIDRENGVLRGESYRRGMVLYEIYHILKELDLNMEGGLPIIDYVVDLADQHGLATPYFMMKKDKKGGDGENK